MPIENERKFVLKPPFSELEQLMACKASSCFLMEQAYVHKEKKLVVRIRATTDTKNENSWYEMTVKRTVKGECVEIETEIDETDYYRLWQVSNGNLKKMRYIVEGWEIDFFKDKNNNNYFAQAEIELPPDIDYPEKIPNIINEHMLYQVMKGDDRFASKKLCDINYTNRILNMLLERKTK
jgi:CYTH domain-containing protein